MLKYCLLGAFLSVLGCSSVPKHTEVSLKPSESTVGASKQVLPEYFGETMATLSDGRQISYDDVILRYQDVIDEYMDSEIRNPTLQSMLEDLNRSISSFSVVMKRKETAKQGAWKKQDESVYHAMHINVWNLMNRIDSILGVKTF